MNLKDVVKLLDKGHAITPNSTAHKLLAELVKKEKKTTTNKDE